MGKTHGFGTTASWDGSLIGEVDSIGDISLSVDTVDASTYTSADAYKEHLQGMIDAGALTIGGNFDQSDSDGQIAFLTDLNARSGVKNLVITFPTSTGAAWTIPAIPTGFTTTQPKDGKIGYTLTVKPSGKPTLSVTASVGMSAVSISNSAVLTPAFAIGTFDYVATVLTGVSSVTVTPTAAAGVIKVNGNVVATTVASSAIPLGAAGSVTIVTVEVKETGKSAKTYTFRIARA